MKLKLITLHSDLAYATIRNRLEKNYDVINIDIERKEVWEYDFIIKSFVLYGNYNTKQELLSLIDTQIKQFFGKSVWWLNITK